MPERQHAISRKLAEKAARCLGALPGELELRLRLPLPHQSNRLYDASHAGCHLIVKEFLKPEEHAEAPWREYRSLEFMAGHDLAPRPLAWAPAAGPKDPPLVIYEFMPGRMWDRSVPTGPQLQALSELYIRMNAAGEGAVWPSRSDAFPEKASGRLEQVLGQYLSFCESEHLEGLEMGERLAASFRTRRDDLGELAGMDPHRCFSRADPRFANVIQRPDGRLGMVDWEDGGQVDPALDIADLLTHPNQEDLLAPSTWRAFLDPYRLHRRLQGDTEFDRRLDLYTGVLLLFRLLTLLEIGLGKAAADALAGWRINGMPARRRLNRYYRQSLAWPRRSEGPRQPDLKQTVFFSGL